MRPIAAMRDFAREYGAIIDITLRISTLWNMTIQSFCDQLIDIEFSGLSKADALEKVSIVERDFERDFGTGEPERVALLNAFRDRDRHRVDDTSLTRPIIDKIGLRQ